MFITEKNQANRARDIPEIAGSKNRERSFEEY